MGKRRSSKGKEEKGRSRGRKSKGGSKGIVIDLSDLARYRHLSLAWFVRMAVAWLVGQDLFEDLVVDSIDRIIGSAVEVVGTLRLSEKERGDVLKYLRGSKDVDLNTEHFMKWEVKEYTRVFGGGGRKVSESFSVRPYVFGLYLLGRGLTRVGGNTYLLMEPHSYLRMFSLSLAGFHEFYNRIRNFVAEYERERANKEKKEEVSATAFLATLAGLVIAELRRNKVNTCMIREVVGIPCKEPQIDINKKGEETKKEEAVGGNVFVLYIVRKDGIIPLDLTSLVRDILRLEMVFRINWSKILASLADEFINHRRGGVVDAMNLVGDTLYRYSVTGDLGYVYNLIRAVTTSESYTDLRNLVFGGGDEGGY